MHLFSSFRRVSGRDFRTNSASARTSSQAPTVCLRGSTRMRDQHSNMCELMRKMRSRPLPDRSCGLARMKGVRTRHVARQTRPTRYQRPFEQATQGSCDEETPRTLSNEGGFSTARRSHRRAQSQPDSADLWLHRRLVARRSRGRRHGQAGHAPGGSNLNLAGTVSPDTRSSASNPATRPSRRRDPFDAVQALRTLDHRDLVRVPETLSPPFPENMAP